MTEFEKKSFSVPMAGNQEYRDRWEATFGKKNPDLPCFVCGKNEWFHSFEEQDELDKKKAEPQEAQPLEDDGVPGGNPFGYRRLPRKVTSGHDPSQ